MKRVSWMPMMILGASMLAAVFGLGFSYPKLLTPRDNFGQFSKIYSDGWLEDGAVIRLPGLGRLGNKLVIEFNAFRPPGMSAAAIRASVCGLPAATFSVEKSGEYFISLKGDCEPRAVSFTVENPFQPSPADARKLGTQVRSVKVTSRLGVPLINYWTMALVSVGILLIALTYYLALPAGSMLRVVQLAWPVAAFLLLSHSIYPRFENVTALALVAGGFGIGLLVAAKSSSRVLMAGLDGRLGRPLGNLSRAWPWLLPIVALGVALRFYGIDFGLPANYHPDEVPKVNAIMRMVDHCDLNPRYFLHPSLLLYLSYGLNSVLHYLGIFDGAFRDSAFLAGRFVSATVGSLSIILVYFIGRRLFSSSAGLVSALALAVFPLHVTCSRYMKEDALLTFAVLLSFLTLIKAVQDDKRWMVVLAGLLAGVAASSKYSGLLAVAMIATAPWLKSRSFMPDFSYIGVTAMALLSAPIGFLICTPYSLITPDKFLYDFGSERRHMMKGHTVMIDAWSQFWMYHMDRSILPGVGLLPTLLAVMGAGILLWRRRFEDLVLVGLVFLFYLPAEWVKAKPEPQPERYILPCLPFLALCIGELFRICWSSRHRALAPLLLVAAILPPLARTIALAREIPNDTRQQMTDWMLANLPQGSKIALDWKPYTPVLPRDHFEVTYIPRPTLIKELSIDNLKNSGQDYLVLSSLFYARYFLQPKTDAGLRQHFRRIFDEVPLVKEISAPHGTYGFHNPTLLLFSLRPQDFAALEKEIAEKKAGIRDQTSNEMQAQFRTGLR